MNSNTPRAQHKTHYGVEIWKIFCLEFLTGKNGRKRQTKGGMYEEIEEVEKNKGKKKKV
jgi:hypothetical protein